MRSAALLACALLVPLAALSSGALSAGPPPGPAAVVGVGVAGPGFVTWTPVQDADFYYVYVGSGSTWYFIGETSDTFWFGGAGTPTAITAVVDGWESSPTYATWVP